MLNLSIPKNSTKDAVQNISQCLFEQEVQGHILHLQAVYRSLETHLALEKYYSALGDLNDNLVEKAYPKTGIIDGYKTMPMKNNFNPLPMIKGEMTKIEKERERIKEGYLQQIVDNILEVFAQTIYRLEQLQ